MPQVPLFRAVRDERAFRPELHGIRGLAIFLVVAFHIFADGQVSGGIDVFLAITGFLALPSLLRRTRSGWYIDLAARFSSLIRRLFIPLLPVLVAVGVAGYFLFPLSEQPQLYSELRASVFFYENWELISSQLTYDAAGPNTSPLQHLWSTSIQGQFHLVMTFLVIGVAWVATRMHLSKKNTLVVVLSLVTIASFGWAWQQGTVNQDAAYFSTLTRAWELTLPGVLGLVVSQMKIPPIVRALMSWAGVALIVSCGFVLDGAALFPGPAALWPVTGICLVLAAGKTHTWWGADRILRLWPFQKVGDISYSLYLWHWPILIFALLLTGKEQADPALAAIVLVLSLAAGSAGKYLFEDRAANWRLAFPRPRRALATGVSITLLSFIAASGALAGATERFDAEVASYEDLVVAVDYPGAAAMVAPDTITIEPRDPLPTADLVRRDAGWYAQVNKETPCIQRRTGSLPTSCQHPEATQGPLVLMVGSSHTGQWSEPIGNLAVEYGWDLEVYEKAGCLLTTDTANNTVGLNITDSCIDWNEQMLDVIEERQPALVITTGTTRLGEEAEMTTPGMSEAHSLIADLDIPLFLFRENPYRTDEWLECLAASTVSDHTQCDSPRDEFYSPSIDAQGIPRVDGTHFFDTSRYVCDAESCYATVGNVRVLRDDNHITATFATSALPFIEDGLRDLAPSLFTPETHTAHR